MKTTNKDFIRFQAACRAYAELFGLQRWRIVFDRRKLHDSYACIAHDSQGMICTATLNSEIPDESLDGWEGPRHHAKHEMIELLLADIEAIAMCRSFSPSDLERSKHVVVRTLEKVIPDIKMED